MIPTHQSRFHSRWRHLRNPHVRTLAWLIDAPSLLDPEAPDWSGRVATLGPADEATAAWLHTLDQDPEPLQAALDIQPQTRLGRYAENLLAFYLRTGNRLVAQNLQVRAARNDTVGEFDFLLPDGQGASLIHWEFATKLYLLEATGAGHVADYFVGPNLADTLGAKIRKIMHRQLALSRHPAAQDVLTLPVTAAQALVKGWLFYHGGTPVPSAPPGISAAHCRGFWCAQSEAGLLGAERYAILPRLKWLAPARVEPSESLGRQALADALAAHFAADSSPLLVAVLSAAGDVLLEVDRGFIVPDDWRERAHRRLTK